MPSRKYNTSVTSGSFTGQTIGGLQYGNTLHLGDPIASVQALSARCNVTANTSNLTISAKWQGSNDNTSWDDVYDNQYDVGVALLATGTGSAVNSVKGIGAPQVMYGYKYARVAFIVGASTGSVTGTTNDSFSVGYTYRQLDPGALV